MLTDLDEEIREVNALIDRARRIQTFAVGVVACCGIVALGAMVTLAWGWLP